MFSVFTKCPFLQGGQFDQIISKVGGSFTFVGMSANPAYEAILTKYGAIDFLLKPNDMAEFIRIEEKIIQ